MIPGSWTRSCLLAIFVALTTAATVRSTIVVLSGSPDVASVQEPTFTQMAVARPFHTAAHALAVADLLAIGDRRVEAARTAVCLESSSDVSNCLVHVEAARRQAPHDGEIPLFDIRVRYAAGQSPRSQNEAVARSCKTAARESWVALLRIPYTAALEEGAFEGVAPCFERDVATLARTTYYSDALADFYLSYPFARERVRTAVAKVGEEEARRFVRKVRSRVDVRTEAR